MYQDHFSLVSFSVIISAWTLQCVIYGRETGLTNTDSANLAGYEY